MANDDFSMALGKRIRTLRKERTGLSQSAFSLKIGMDRVYFGQVERGEYAITVLRLRLIAEGLDMTLSELLEGL